MAYFYFLPSVEQEQWHLTTMLLDRRQWTVWLMPSEGEPEPLTGYVTTDVIFLFCWQKMSVYSIISAPNSFTFHRQEMSGFLTVLIFESGTPSKKNVLQFLFMIAHYPVWLNMAFHYSKGSGTHGQDSNERPFWYNVHYRTYCLLRVW